MFIPRRVKAMGLIATGIAPVVIAYAAPDLIKSIQTGRESILTGILLLVLLVVCIACFITLVFTRSRRSNSNEDLSGNLQVVAVKPMFLQSSEEKLLTELETLSGHKPLACTYLGGSGSPMLQNAEVLLTRLSDSLIFTNSGTVDRYAIPFGKIYSVEVSGPGTQTTNAGISGGGFGVEGFLQGVAVAATLNALTSRSSTNTFLRILSEDAEIYLHSSATEPTQLRMLLSPVVVAIEKHKNGQRSRPSSLSDEIARLESMHKSGILNIEEFEAAKRKILGL